MYYTYSGLLSTLSLQESRRAPPQWGVLTEVIKHQHKVSCESLWNNFALVPSNSSSSVIPESMTSPYRSHHPHTHTLALLTPNQWTCDYSINLHRNLNSVFLFAICQNQTKVFYQPRHNNLASWGNLCECEWEKRNTCTSNRWISILTTCDSCIFTCVLQSVSLSKFSPGFKIERYKASKPNTITKYPSSYYLTVQFEFQVEWRMKCNSDVRYNFWSYLRSMRDVVAAI